MRKPGITQAPHPQSNNATESIYLLYEETLDSINLEEHFSAIISSTSIDQIAWPLPIILKLFSSGATGHSCTNEQR